MHRSRISTLLIDVAPGDADAAGAFWGGAVGTTVTPNVDEPQYRSVKGAVPGLSTAIQRLEGADEVARYHLDFETDDVEAETARLEALGAVKAGLWQGCQAMEVPGGLLICVIPVHSDPAEFEANARVWN